MWYDSTISSYGDINYKINRAYCDKNNMVFKIITEKELFSNGNTTKSN